MLARSVRANSQAGHFLFSEMGKNIYIMYCSPCTEVNVEKLRLLGEDRREGGLGVFGDLLPFISRYRLRLQSRPLVSGQNRSGCIL